MSKKVSRMELILLMGQEYRALLAKYPDKSDTRGWRTLALGIAIAALAEEEHRVDDWRQIFRKKRKRRDTL